MCLITQPWLPSLHAIPSHPCRVSGSVNATSGSDIGADAYFDADLSVKVSILPVSLKFTCKLCGENCTVTIPVVGKKETIAMPPCPLASAGQTVAQTFSQALPATDPVPGGLHGKVSGTISAYFKSGAKIADVAVSGSI